MNCLFSVIIPAYNTEKFVRETLGSLFAQKCQDFEIIFIDDGSTDKTPLIARDALNKWGGRFTFIRQNNQGPGKARNEGMKLAQGKYLYFLDSDDVVLPDCFSKCKERVLNESPDLIFSGWERIDEKGDTIPGEEHCCPPDFSPSEDPAERLMQFLNGEFPALIAGFFTRRGLLIDHKIFFSTDIVVSEDVDFMSKCFLLAQSIEVLTQYLVCYRKRSFSTTQLSNFSLENTRAHVGLSFRLLAFIRKEVGTTPSLEKFLSWRLRVHILFLLREQVRAGRCDLFFKSRKNQIIREQLLDIFRGEGHELEHRLKAGLILWFPALFIWRYRLKYRKKQLLSK